MPRHRGATLSIARPVPFDPGFRPAHLPRGSALSATGGPTHLSGTAGGESTMLFGAWPYASAVSTLRTFTAAILKPGFLATGPRIECVSRFAGASDQWNGR